MPATTQYLRPSDSKRIDSTRLHAQSLERAFRDNYTSARKYYDGDQTKPLKVEEDGIDDNVIINLVKMAADRTISFLFPTMPKLVLDANSADDNENEQWLLDSWEHNGGLSLLLKMALTGFLSGHNFVLVQPPIEGNEYSRVILLDPLRVVPYWHVSDINKVVYYEIMWQSDKFKYILDVVNIPKSTQRRPVVGNIEHEMAENPDKYIVERSDNGDGTFEDNLYELYEVPEHWELIQYKGIGYQDMIEQDRAVWNSPYGPIVHWQHLPRPNSFFGGHEFTNKGLQDVANLMFSNINRIIRYHGSPKTVVTGVLAEDVVPTAVNGLWAIENPDAKVVNLEMQSELRAAQEILQLAIDSFFAEARVVLLKRDVKDFQRVTNAGVRTAFMDALSKNSILRQQYHPAIANISHRMALAAGSGDLIPEVVGSDPLPTDELEVLNVMKLEYDMGITSQQYMAQRRRIPWETIKQQRKAEEAEGLVKEQQSNSQGLTSTEDPV